MKKNIKLILIVIIGPIAAIISYWVTSSIEKSRLNTIFEKDAVERVNLIENSIKMTQLVTESMRNLFLVSDTISQKEFKNFLNSYNQRVKGIQAIEWVPRVKYSNKDKFIEKARRTVFSNYDIVQLDPDGSMVPVKEKNEYFPIYYLEPYKNNERSLGFDLSSNKERNKALVNAITNNRFAASERLELVQDTLSDYGIILFEPVIKHSLAYSANDKMDKDLLGVIGAVFKPKWCVLGTISVLQSGGIDIYLKDESAPPGRQLLYYYNSDSTDNNGRKGIEKADFKYYEQFTFGDRTWSLTFIPKSEFFQSHQAFIPLLVSLIFLLLTGFFAFYYYVNLIEKDKINKEVEERTKELEESTKRLDLAINGADLGIWDWNIASGSIFTNERLASMLEYKEKEIPDNIDDWQKLFHPNDSEEVLEILDQHLEGYTPIYTTEHRMKTKSGNYKWIQSIGKVFNRDEKGNPLRAVGIFLDITERKFIQQKLLRYSQMLEKQNIEKSKLFSIISHDLKSPLVSVNGFSEMLINDMDQLDNSEIRKYCIYIHQASISLNSILEGLAEWGQLQLGQVAFMPKHYLLSKQIEKVISQQKVNALNKEIEIESEFPENLRVFADEIMIETSLRNLISNAIKFTPKGGKIKVSVKQNDDKSITISVSDTGVGMTKDQIDGLFKNSYHTSTVGTNGEKGTGLGLGICKEFIEKNGGKIWVESAVDVGTTFNFNVLTENVSKLI